MSLVAALAAAPQPQFGWMTAGAVAVAAAAFIAAFVFLRRCRTIEDMPTSRLRSAAQGYIEVEGFARLMDGPPIICPLSATRCAWWRYKIEEKRQDVGDRNSRWVTIASAESDDCFLLDDGSGTCIVNPAGASVIPGATRSWYGYTSRPDVSYEQGRGWWRQLWCKYRYTEELLHLTRPLYALGAFRTQTGMAESFDERADLNDLLLKWKHDPKMMALFDTNKDGHVDAREWEAARRMGLAQVRREQVERAVATPDLNILAKPRDGKPYILSGVPQAALVRRYRGYAIASLATTATLAVTLLSVLRARGAL